MQFHQAPVKHVSYVDINVTDLERSTAFYQQVVGFRVLSQDESTVALSADGEQAILTIHQLSSPKRETRRTAGLYHFAILLPTRADLADFIKHIAEQNVQIGASDHWVSESIYFADPDGNGIEVYADRDPSEWSWENGEVAMAVDPLDARDVLSHATEAGWQGLPTQTIMGHIHLHVADLDETKQFYTDALGLDIVCRFGGQALFIADGHYHHHIAINTWNGVGADKPSQTTPGLKSFTLKLNGEDDKQVVLNQLEAFGAPIEHEGNTTVTVDPSGNRVRLDV
ncbi:catechol 2,3-dioxygenase [Alkalibacillus flavidus]|uniref:Catechol 2,3-dioxygenase n=1 Tax=Alkalibacillus flavidus TaxID=546021 RepID=A0ABV2KTS2_9BACI